MHELSMAQALVGKVEQVRARENADAVLSVTVSIGALSGVDRDSIEFAFRVATDGTAAEGALLAVEEKPAEVSCDDCAATSPLDLNDVRCGKCGSQRVRITGGRDFMLLSVELRKD